MDGLDLTTPADSGAPPADLLTPDTGDTSTGGDEGFDLGAEGQQEGGEEGGEEGQQQTQSPEDAEGGPYTTKFSREYREALNKWSKSDPNRTPEENALIARVAKTARDNHGRLFELNKLEPNGIEGVREKYALMESLGDTTEVQGRIQQMEETDNLLRAGDPKGLDSLDASFDAGLSKLAPTFLDRVQRANPEAYAAAILPHLYQNLITSPLVDQLNALINLANAPSIDSTIEGIDPTVAQQIQFNDARQKMVQLKGAMDQIGKYFGGLDDKVKALKAPPVVDPRQEQIAQREREFEAKEQKAHWSEKIKSPFDQYASKKFDEFLNPYMKRLKLDPATISDLRKALDKKAEEVANADKQYVNQMNLFRKQRFPDPANVQNYLQAFINRNAQSIVDAVVKGRYGRFLNGPAPRAATTNGASSTPKGTANTGAGTLGAPLIVAAKPQEGEVDWRSPNTDIIRGRYQLKNGKVVQLRQSA